MSYLHSLNSGPYSSTPNVLHSHFPDPNNPNLYLYQNPYGNSLIYGPQLRKSRAPPVNTPAAQRDHFRRLVSRGTSEIDEELHFYTLPDPSLQARAVYDSAWYEDNRDDLTRGDKACNSRMCRR